MANAKGARYLCTVCESVIECLEAGPGEVNCCSEPMTTTEKNDTPHAATIAPQGVFKCSGCGYRFRGDNPPDRCPSCGETCEFTDATDYVPGLSRDGEEFTCAGCGTRVRYLRDRGGRLTCCGEPMKGRFPGHEDKTGN